MSDLELFFRGDELATRLLEGLRYRIEQIYKEMRRDQGDHDESEDDPVADLDYATQGYWPTNASEMARHFEEMGHGPKAISIQGIVAGFHRDPTRENELKACKALLRWLEKQVGLVDEGAQEAETRAKVPLDEQGVGETLPAHELSKTAHAPPEQNGEPQCWFQPSDAQRPETYLVGPLIGQKKQLSNWVNLKDARTLENKCREGIYWARQIKRTEFALFFKTQEQYAAANAKRIEEQEKAKKQSPEGQRSASPELHCMPNCIELH